MRWFWQSKLRSIASIAAPLPLDRLKRLARIVVVDDEADSVPTDALRENGYSVEYWPQLDSPRLARLERGEFDIVMLDIQGIVPANFSDTGNGLGVLRRLKATNPNQIVIACSGQSYTIDAMEFYRNADATLAKPISALRAMQTLDQLLRERISAERYWEGVVALLQRAGVSDARISRLEADLVRSTERQSALSIDSVRARVGDVRNIVTIGELVNKIFALATG